LEEKDHELDDLTANLKERDIRIKELEIELLTANQRQLSGDGEHAQEMREMADKLDQCRVSGKPSSLKLVSLL
jgi:predicted RNase H-like nuclease (RuvC/YqgF family)